MEYKLYVPSHIGDECWLVSRYEHSIVLDLRDHISNSLIVFTQAAIPN